MPVETQYSSLSVERQRVNFNRSVTYRYLHCSSALWQLQPDAPVVTASRVSNPICQKKISAPTKGASERKLPERGRAVNPYEHFYPAIADSRGGSPPWSESLPILYCRRADIKWSLSLPRQWLYPNTSKSKDITTNFGSYLSSCFESWPSWFPYCSLPSLTGSIP